MEIEEPFLLENFPQCNPSDLSFADFDHTTDLSDLNFDDIFDDVDIDLFLNDSPLNPIDSKSNSPNSNFTTSSNPESPNSNNTNNNKRKIDDVDNLRASNSNPNIDDKRKARLVRNRESAQLSRQRKKQHVQELEQKVKILTSTVADLNGKLAYYMAENVRLHSIAKGNAGNSRDSVYPPPTPPMPYHYPWVPYVPYPMKPNSIPIPRLNKEESKRSGRKRKKLASISSMGLFLLAMLVIGGVTNFGLTENKETDGDGGKVLDMKSHDLCSKNSFNSSNTSNNKMVEFGNVGEMYSEVMSGLGDKSSKSLPALLYVPKNGKHVEINGNLVIQSVLASERAVTNESLGLNEKSLASANPVGSALALSNSRDPTRCGNINEHMKALPSVSNGVYRDEVKSTLADKYLQQWFLEGLAGPGLSSATCTEVFQLDVSPSAASVLNNVTNKLPPSSNIRSRRMGQPIPLTGKIQNNKTQQFEKAASVSNNTFHGKPSSSSIVVSVLFDPKEASDVDCDGIVTPKAFSRIFVVLLVDSVKYITYSCMLPLRSSVPRVVN